jgi:transcriptional regulator with XRE-family HTH domain
MLSDTLAALRRGRGLTQAALAARARVTAGYIALIETGARRNPSLDVLARVAAALAVPASALIDATGTEAPRSTSRGRRGGRKTR